MRAAGVLLLVASAAVQAANINNYINLDGPVKDVDHADHDLHDRSAGAVAQDGLSNLTRGLSILTTRLSMLSKGLSTVQYDGPAVDVLNANQVKHEGPDKYGVKKAHGNKDELAGHSMQQDNGPES